MMTERAGETQAQKTSWVQMVPLFDSGGAIESEVQKIKKNTDVAE